MDLPINTYAQIRRSWCFYELLQFLKRWGVYIVITLLLLGSGATAGFTGMEALLAWAVYPLFRAASQAMHIALLATLAHSLIGGMVIFALRPLLWSPTWREAESALPLSRSTLRGSDAQIVLMVLLPLATVYATGAATWIASGAAWVAPVRMAALSMVAASLLGSVAWGLAVLQLWRWPLRWKIHLRAQSGLRPNRNAPSSSTVERPSVAMLTFTTWTRAYFLILLPLWRGPAKRVMRLLQITVAVGAVCCIALPRWPSAIGWTLAIYALVSLGLTTRLCKLINTDLAPLHDACAPLPIAPIHLLRARQTLAIAPQTLSLVLIFASGWAMHDALHITPLVGFVLVSSVFHTVLTVKSLARRESKSQDEAAWWLVALVIVVAFASEVGL